MPENPIPALVIINGAKEITVTMLDGTTETVGVRLVPLSKIGEYFDKVGDMPAFIELLTDKPAGWASLLADDSAYAIDSIGRALNDPRFVRLLGRQQEALTKLVPLAQEVSELTASLQKR
jgi:hypothetical protein